MALLFSGAEPFVQFWVVALCERIPSNYFEFGPVVQVEIWSSGGLLFSGAEPFVQYLKKVSRGTIP